MQRKEQEEGGIRRCMLDICGGAPGEPISGSLEGAMGRLLKAYGLRPLRNASDQSIGMLRKSRAYMRTLGMTVRACRPHG